MPVPLLSQFLAPIHSSNMMTTQLLDDNMTQDIIPTSETMDLDRVPDVHLMAAVPAPIVTGRPALEDMTTAELWAMVERIENGLVRIRAEIESRETPMLLTADLVIVQLEVTK